MEHINNDLPTCSVFFGDFNATSAKLCNNDITNANGCALHTLASSAEYKQIINKLTHTVNSSFS